MLKKILYMVAGGVIATLVLGVAGFAYAQTQTPPASVPNTLNYGQGGNFSGRMGRWNQSGSYGLMHPYLIDAMATKLGISAGTLQSELTAGKTMFQIAQEQGISEDEFKTLVAEAAQDAVAKMVADGVITQSQSEWMVQRTQTMLQNGFGFGLGGGCMNGYRGGSRGRWSLTPDNGS